MVSRAPADTPPTPEDDDDPELDADRNARRRTEDGKDTVERLFLGLSARLSASEQAGLADARCEFRPPDLLTFTVPNAFRSRWLERHLTAQIRDVARSLLPVEPRLEFLVAADSWHPGPSRPSSVRVVHNGKRKGIQTGGLNPDLADARHLSPSPFAPHLTFDGFLVGPANRLAQAAALSIGEAPGEQYNPLFIHGGRGVGKSHLFHATGNYLVHCHIVRTGIAPRIALFNADTFTTAFVEAVRRDDGSFREHCLECDALFVEDIHFLAEKRKTLEELATLIDAFVDDGKQVVVTSSCSPGETRGIPPRLVTRFRWGLSTLLKPPEVETKIAALLISARQFGIDLPVEVADFVSRRIRGSFHELDGAFRRLANFANARRESIRIETARELLDGSADASPGTIGLSQILDLVAEYFQLRPRDLVARSKARSLTRPRQVAMYLARELTQLSLNEIGMQLGGRDHTTVLYGVRRVGELRREDPHLESAVELLRNLLSSPAP